MARTVTQLVQKLNYIFIATLVLVETWACGVETPERLANGFWSPFD
tara:strand:- start:3147 stop:3284 length:138 start_codon:yes stop_codon:yes gene_type:complete